MAMCVPSTAPAHWGNPHLCLKPWITSLSEFPVGTFMYLGSSTSHYSGAYLFYNEAYCRLRHTEKMSNSSVVCCGCQSLQSKCYSLLNWYSLVHDCVLFLNGLLEFITQICKCGPWHLVYSDSWICITCWSYFQCYKLALILQRIDHLLHACS